jgi:hypothetical protein
MTIEIDNFSLGVNEWLPIVDLGYFAVDVTDSTYGINSSGTYFIHSGQIVLTTFSGIIDGYRCYYYPASVYSSGVINLVIHAENTNSEIREQLFRLLYGYNCKFNELIDWGSKQDVVFTIEAANLAFCSNTEGEAFYFETAELPSRDLGASIRAISSVDLNAVLYPQNTFFFYGRTYTITVSGIRDFSGNELVPYVFIFTIEDPTN